MLQLNKLLNAFKIIHLTLILKKMNLKNYNRLNNNNNNNKVKENSNKNRMMIYNLMKNNNKDHKMIRKSKILKKRLHNFENFLWQYILFIDIKDIQFTWVWSLKNFLLNLLCLSVVSINSLPINPASFIVSISGLNLTLFFFVL